MDAIKLATPEQVERIRAKADLEIGAQPYALGESIAVVRQQTRIDPVFYDPNTNTKQRMLFIWGLETHLRLLGVPAYYFNVDPSDTAYIAAVEHYGAERVNAEPQLEFKKVLN